MYYDDFYGTTSIKTKLLFVKYSHAIPCYKQISVIAIRLNYNVTAKKELV